MKELKNTVVNVKTREEYNELMDMYEKAGWKWSYSGNPKELSVFTVYGEETCITIEKVFGYSTREFFQERGNKIISFQEFKNMQEKTFKTLEVGDLIQDITRDYRKILAVTNRGDENSESVYIISDYNEEKTSRDLRKVGAFRTSYELEEGRVTIVKEETKVEPKKMTVAEVAKALGHEVEIVK